MPSPEDQEHLADLIAPDIATLLEAIDACSDPDLLRAALKVVVTAVPDLVVTTDPVEAILATVSDAIKGAWP